MEEKGVLGDMSYRVPCVSYRQSIQSNIEGVVGIVSLDIQSQRPRYRKISEPARPQVPGKTWSFEVAGLGLWHWVKGSSKSP